MSTAEEKARKKEQIQKIKKAFRKQKHPAGHYSTMYALTLIGALGMGAVGSKLASNASQPTEKVVSIQKTPNEQLMDAAIKGNVHAVSKALEQGADINYQDPQTGETALMATVKHNLVSRKTVKALRIVDKALNSGNVDLSLKDADNQSLENIIDVHLAIEDAHIQEVWKHVDHCRVSGIGEHIIRWRKVLDKLHEVQKNQNSQTSQTSSAGKTFYGFSQMMRNSGRG